MAFRVCSTLLCVILCCVTAFLVRRVEDWGKSPLIAADASDRSAPDLFDLLMLAKNKYRFSHEYNWSTGIELTVDLEIAWSLGQEMERDNLLHCFVLSIKVLD